MTTAFRHGRPSWANLSAPDPDAALDFYQRLFGWSHRVGPSLNGSRYVLTLGDKAVVGIDCTRSEGPAEWTDFFAVDDVDLVAKSVAAAGGKVLVVPTAVGDAGRIAVFADTAGATFATWEAGTEIGTEIRLKPATYIAGELGANDFEASKSFYTAALGWGWIERGTKYAEATVDGLFVCGVMIGDGFEHFGRPRGPDSWLTYFASGDVSADVESAKAMGATVVIPATDNGLNQEYAVLTDPQGAVFG